MEVGCGGQGVVVVAEVTDAEVVPQCKLGSVGYLALTGLCVACN